MDMMFTIPGNTLLVIGFGIMLATIGFVIYGLVKGRKRHARLRQNKGRTDDR